MARHLLYLFTLTCLFALKANGQITPQGVQIIYGTVSTVGREIYRSSEQNRQRKEQEKTDTEYDDLIAWADGLFAKGDYTIAMEKYNAALALKEEQYPRDQIARCQAELARANRSEFQLLMDKGDSLANIFKWEPAIESYTAAHKLTGQQVAENKINETKANQELWSKVHFSGLYISDNRVDGFTSKAFSKDPFSDFMKPGKYPILDQAITYSNFQTLDGIAIPEGMKVVIYSEPNYKGEVLLNAVGPMIINNIAINTSSDTQAVQSKSFDGQLNTIFPSGVRFFSNSNMNQWITGSMEIIQL